MGITAWVRCYLISYHHNLSLRKCGLIIGNPAYLAASPDGVLGDQLGKTSGIEVKCPLSASKFSVREACTQLPNFYCSEVGDELVLHNDHAYLLLPRVDNGEESIKLPYTASKWSRKVFPVIIVNSRLRLRWRLNLFNTLRAQRIIESAILGAKNEWMVKTQ